VVGNLPYHLTSPILFSLLDQVERVSRAVFLVQREVAERLAAAPGTKDWGILSVLLQREADVSIERIVPRGAFLPPPKVESAVICALFRPPADAVADPDRFRRLVKGGFGQRRKTLANALRAAAIAPPEALAEALARAGVDPVRRGETLTVAEWAALDRALGAPVATAS
jgi:16S rRNA (adenine1518-N6/adenine1519-N6)-dimethyltransferase